MGRRAGARMGRAGGLAARAPCPRGEFSMSDLHNSPSGRRGANFTRSRPIQDMHVNERIARLAARQHGVVSARQLLALGLGRGAIEHRLRTGQLHQLHRGIYAVGYRRLTREGHWLAAVLACGDGAVLSHGSAAAHLDLRPWGGGAIDVTVPYRTGRARRAGLRIHRSTSLPSEETTVHDAIPVTTLARTLLDLADTTKRSTVQRAVERAEVLRSFDLRAIDATIERHPKRPGSSRLATVLADYVQDEPTRSEMENRFLSLCSEHGLPRPRVNPQIGIYTVDFLWPQRRLIVEADSRKHHATRAAFEADRARDAELTVAGYRVVRFTYRQIERDPAAVAATIDRLLRSGARSGS